MKAITRTDAATRALAEATSVADVQDIGAKAEALRHYARLAQDRTEELKWVEVQVRAERRLGQMLIELKAEGRLSEGTRFGGSSGGSSREPPGDVITLADIKVTKKRSMRAQAHALVPDDQFEAEIAAWREEEARRATRAIGSLSKRIARPGAARTPPLPEGRYRVIYADPPWEHVTWSSAGMDRSPDNHYSTMPTAEICALPIDYIAADDCALFIWVYGPRLPDALKVIEFWGFAYKSIGFVWAKSNGEPEAAPIGQGHWTRAQSEICLLATRGAPRRLDKGVRQIIAAPRGAHSVKPEEAYGRIERLLAGPYIELFARQTRPGWDAWGA